MSNKKLEIKAKFLNKGLGINVNGRSYKIIYPNDFWSRVPLLLRRILLENITFAETHWLPLLLKKDVVVYNTPLPFFEALFFKNQLYDLLNCERADGVKHLSYLKKFYNLDLVFNSRPSALPIKLPSIKKSSQEPVAVLPFTFGKESLATLGLCLESGIKPVLVYCQEPSQPFEEKYKLKKLKDLSVEYNVPFCFIKHEPGLFRYGKAFNFKKTTDIGWGTQITLLSLLALPIIYKYKANYLLFGNEYLNNEVLEKKGWKVYPSFDQTNIMTPAQNNLVSSLTGGRCLVASSLEPLEEISIFYLLHHRYPKLGQFQFSCSAEKPLLKGSQWCHKCYKCCRMYLFATISGIDPGTIGFKKNLLEEPKLWNHYFGKAVKTGSTTELDFSFYLLYKQGNKSACVELFKKYKLSSLKSWLWYAKYFGQPKSSFNLPLEYQKNWLDIFKQELASFRKLMNKYEKKQ